MLEAIKGIKGFALFSALLLLVLMAIVGMRPTPEGNRGLQQITATPQPDAYVEPVSGDEELPTSAAVNWTAVGVIVSLATSLVTLYVAHLRGPDIKLAKSKGLHRCRHVDLGPEPPVYDPERPTDDYGHPIRDMEEVVLEAKLVIANLGNRPGVLFDVDIHALDNPVWHLDPDPRPSDILPTSLLPGEAWETILRIYLKPRSGTLPDYAERTETLPMQVIYWRSRPFPWQKQDSTETLRIDLDPLRASLAAEKGLTIPSGGTEH